MLVQIKRKQVGHVYKTKVLLGPVEIFVSQSLCPSAHPGQPSKKPCASFCEPLI